MLIFNASRYLKHFYIGFNKDTLNTNLKLPICSFWARKFCLLRTKQNFQSSHFSAIVCKRMIATSRFVREFFIFKLKSVLTYEESFRHLKAQYNFHLDFIFRNRIHGLVARSTVRLFFSSVLLVQRSSQQRNVLVEIFDLVGNDRFSIRLKARLFQCKMQAVLYLKNGQLFVDCRSRMFNASTAHVKQLKMMLRTNRKINVLRYHSLHPTKY